MLNRTQNKSCGGLNNIWNTRFFVIGGLKGIATFATSKDINY